MVEAHAQQIAASGRLNYETRGPDCRDSMKPQLNPRTLIFALTVLVLAAALPFSLRYAYQHGGLYLFSREFLEDLPKRLSGPGRFRFVLQPTVAIFLGIRAGIADGRAGRPPYIFSLVFHAHHRLQLVKEGLKQLSTLIAVAILLDAISQFLILRAIYPGAALVVGPVLISIPYALSRALANRWVRVKTGSQIS